MPRLIHLPDGQWVASHAVLSIEARRNREREGSTVYVQTRNRTLYMACESLELAEAWRDEIADAVVAEQARDDALHADATSGRRRGNGTSPGNGRGGPSGKPGSTDTPVARAEGEAWAPEGVRQ